MPNNPSGRIERAGIVRRAGMLAGTLGLAAASFGAQAAITDNLVLHLPFDSNLIDGSGLGHHGTAVGTVTFGAGKVGAGAANLSFSKSGTNFNYVTVGTPAPLQFGTSTDFSVSFWVKFSSFVFDPPFIGNKDWLSGQFQGWMIATGTDGRLQWNYGGAPGQRKDYDGPGGTLSDGQWHHVAVTFLRAGEVVTYLDGVNVDERDVSVSLNDVSTPAGLALNIGQDGTGRYTDGNSVEVNDLMMDDVGIWRRVLTASEVIQIRQAGLSGQSLTTVVSTPEAPLLVKQPVPQDALAGGNVTFRVLPRGTSPFVFQWYRNNSLVPGATNALLSLTNVQASDAGQYRCDVSNVAGIIPSDTADLFVDSSQPPVISKEPIASAVPAGSRAQFSVVASGVAPLTFQWLKEGIAIPGANQPTFAINRTVAADAGAYQVRVNAGNGQFSLSNPVRLDIISDLRQGLVTHLTFDSDFTDLSGRGNHGTAVGTPSLVDGLVGGKALRYSHTASEFNFVTLGQPDDLEFSTDADFSFSFWTRFTTWTRDPLFVSNKRWSSGGNVGYALATGADGRFQWNYAEQVGERRDYDSEGGRLSDGRWHHVAVTFRRGGEAVAYLDGVEVNRQPLPTTGTTISPGLPTNIGQDGSGTYTDGSTVTIADGTLDDLGIWRRAISTEEVQEIYRKGLAGANLQQPDPTADLVLYLPFDDDSWDRSGKGNHGRRVGNPNYSAGRIGGSISVSSLKEGTSFNYVSVGAPADLQFDAGTSFTVSLWTRITNWTGDPVLIGNKNWSSGGNQGWVIATASNGRYQWNLGDGDAGGRTRVDYDGPANTLSDGAWHHLATVFSRTGLSLTYLDGQLVSSNTITAELGSVATPAGLALNIGQDGRGAYTDNGAVGILQAGIDDVAIWRRALTGAELSAIHARGLAGRGVLGQGALPGTLPQGVASGDLTPTSAILWARTTARGAVRFDVSTSRDLSSPIASGSVQVTTTEIPAKWSVTGLQPGTTYWYRALDAAGSTAFGTFRTASAAGTRPGLRFGVSGDSRGDLAPFPAIANAAGQNLDFFVNLGDTIYADYPSPAVPLPRLTELADFRRKHSEVYGERLGVPSLADLRASTAYFTTIDDHEVINDFAGGAPSGSDNRFDTNGAFLNESLLYRNGLQAFIEYNPLADSRWTAPSDPRTDGRPRLYRASRFGSDAALFLIDARSFRDAELPGVGDPTSPAEIGAFIARSFDINPANGQPLPRRTMLGRTQLDALKQDLLAADEAGVTWKFIMVPEPVQNLGVLAASDRFEGYAAERTELLRFIHERGLRNVVFVAADIHGTLVNNLTYQLGPGAPQIPVDAWEISTGAIAFDAPFGPTVLELASAVPAGGGKTLLDVFLAGLGLPNRAAFDAFLTPAQKNTALGALVNGQIQPLGYTPVGLQDSGLATTNIVGGPVATFTYGWTQFEISPGGRRLTVSTFGIPSYTGAEIGLPLLLRQPSLVQQFTVEAQRPSLTARLDGGDVVVSWPKGFAGFVLELAGEFNATVWTPVASAPVANGFEARIPAASSAFLRLRAP
jgi:phosphodiesterase/alkaline phosphatase D-like protein